MKIKRISQSHRIHTRDTDHNTDRRSIGDEAPEPERIVPVDVKAETHFYSHAVASSRNDVPNDCCLQTGN